VKELAIPKYSEVTPAIIKELQSIVGPENVLTETHDLLSRAMVHAVFRLSRWKEHMPDVVVLPSITSEVVEIVKLANLCRIPLVPRAGGSGVADGAVPLKKGIVVDVKRMNKIIEIDEENMCVTVQPGVNLDVLNSELEKRGYILGDDPYSRPVACIGGRIGPSGWSTVAGKYGHVKDMVTGLKVVLPQGSLLKIGGLKKKRSWRKP